MLGIIVDPTTNSVTDLQAVLEDKTSDELLKEIEGLKSKLEAQNERDMRNKFRR